MSAQTITCKLRSQVGRCESAVFRKRFARSRRDVARESVVVRHKASATGSAHIFAPAAIVSHPGTPFFPADALLRRPCTTKDRDDQGVHGACR